MFEADITACFDELSHSAILDRVRRRIGDKRVLALIKSFLKAGIMSEAGQVEGTVSGTPQGGIASPQLANIALSALDEHFCAEDDHGTRWQREKHRKNGGAYRIIRYADDFVGLLQGGYTLGAGLTGTIAAVLLPGHGWRPLFLITFAPVVIVLVSSAFLRESRRLDAREGGRGRSKFGSRRYDLRAPGCVGDPRRVRCRTDYVPSDARPVVSC